METTIKQRVMTYIENIGITVREFERVCGMANGYVRGIDSSIGEKKLKTISLMYPNLNIEWLLTGEGSMLKESSQYESRKTIRYWTDVDATGGGVQLYDDTMTNSIVEMVIPSFSDCTDAINIYGDSMSPLYKSGQIILMKEWTESFIEYGKVYLVITKSGNRMVKYLRKSDTQGKVVCASENPKYEPFEIETEDIVKIYIVKGGIYRDAQ